MISAKDARELTKLPTKLLKLGERIEAAATDGEFFIYANDLSETVQTALRLEGYDVTPTVSTTYRIGWAS